jgi:hypothetical protein
MCGLVPRIHVFFRAKGTRGWLYKHGYDDKGVKDIERRLAGAVPKRELDSHGTSLAITKK